MLDSSDKLVWQASLPLRKPKKKETQEEVIKQIVSNIFNDYTYRSGSKIPDRTLVKYTQNESKTIFLLSPV